MIPLLQQIFLKGFFYSHQCQHIQYCQDRRNGETLETGSRGKDPATWIQGKTESSCHACDGHGARVPTLASSIPSRPWLSTVNLGSHSASFPIQMERCKRGGCRACAVLLCPELHVCVCVFAESKKDNGCFLPCFPLGGHVDVFLRELEKWYFFMCPLVLPNSCWPHYCEIQNPHVIVSLFQARIRTSLGIPTPTPNAFASCPEGTSFPFPLPTKLPLWPPARKLQSNNRNWKDLWPSPRTVSQRKA